MTQIAGLHLTTAIDLRSTTHNNDMDKFPVQEISGHKYAGIKDSDT
jgi:hypothetical protein